MSASSGYSDEWQPSKCRIRSINLTILSLPDLSQVLISIDQTVILQHSPQATTRLKAPTPSTRATSPYPSPPVNMKLSTFFITGLALAVHATPVALIPRAASAAAIDDAATKLDALSAKVQSLSASISTPPFHFLPPRPLVSSHQSPSSLPLPPAVHLFHVPSRLTSITNARSIPSIEDHPY